MRVIYLDVDSLRADHVTAYGYKRPTTPNIDRLAAEGVRFTHCYTSDSPCMPSRAATLSGMFGIKNGIVSHGERSLKLNGQQNTLPLVLRRQGIPAVAVSSFGRHPSPWFYVGWDEVIDPIDRPQLGFQQIAGEAVMDRAIDWLKRHQQQDSCYLYIQMWDPHGIYEAPESFVRQVKNNHYPEHPTAVEVEAHQQDLFWHCAKGMGITSYQKWKDMIDEYDAEIRYADHQIGRLLDTLEELGMFDDTLIILSADHSEEFGEHRVYREHWSVNNGTQHIPLIIRDPRRDQKGQIFERFVYQLDISATVCDALGIKPPEQWDSRSLFQQLDHPNSARPYLVCSHGLYTAQRAVFTPEWKLIRTFFQGEWDVPEVQLYRTDDFWEQKNMAQEYPEVVGQLDSLLRHWEQENRIGLDPLMGNAVEKTQGVSNVKRWLERFQETGVPMPMVRETRKPNPKHL